MSNLEYRKFRVRSPVKSFRDLEVYQISTRLSAEIFGLKIPTKYRRNKDVIEEVGKLKEMSKIIPRLIVESYSDKFSDLGLAGRKLEQSAAVSNLIVAKIDFLNALIENEEFRGAMMEILKKYQRIKMRIINLKKAWFRVFGGGKF